MMASIQWIILTVSIQVIALVAVTFLAHRLVLRGNPRASSRLMALSMALLVVLGIAAFLPVPSILEIGAGTTETDAVAAVQSPSATDIEEVAQDQLPPVDLNSNKSDSADSTPALAAFNWQEKAQLFFNQLRSNTQDSETQATSAGMLVSVISWSVIALVVIGVIRLLGSAISIRRLRLRARRVSQPQILTATQKICQRIGCQRNIELYVSDSLATAATIGIRRPAIFLSADFDRWSPEVQRSVLAHEIAHIHHSDYAANVVSQIATALHFFNPLVHWLGSQMRLNQEVAADQVAAKVISGKQRYVEVLATLALRQDDGHFRLASAFLAPQTAFLKRIKTLGRDGVSVSTKVQVLLQASLLVAAIAIGGVRLPATPDVSGEANSAAEHFMTQEDSKKSEFLTDYVGNHPDRGVLFLRPADLMESSIAKQFFDIGPFKSAQRQFEENLEQETGVGTSQVEQVIAVVQEQEGKGPMSWNIFRTYEDNLENFKALGEVSGNENKFPVEIRRAKSYANFGLIVDKKTIIWTNDEETIETIREIKKRSAINAPWYSSFKKLAKRDVVVIGSPQLLRMTATGLLSEEQLGTVASARSIVAAADVGRRIRYELSLKYASATPAKKAHEMMQELQETWKNMLAIASSGREIMTRSLSLSGIESLDEMEMKLDSNTVKLSSTFEIDMKKLKDSSSAIRDAARKTQGMNNQRQLALAMLNYDSAYGHFPKSVMTHESGQKYSWRIALLPYVERNDIYEKYRFDEPWDSEHNAAVTKEMPEVFKHPASESKTNTSYFVVTGKETIFNGEDTPFTDILDGTANTVLIVESARRDCHWAKPEDIPFEEAAKVKTLGGHDAKTFAVTLANGAVFQLPNDIDPSTFKKLLTMAGGEEVDMEALQK